MFRFSQMFAKVLLEKIAEPITAGDIVDKQIAKMSKGMTAGQSGRMIAQGNTALGYHTDVNARKPQIINQITSFTDDRETGDKLPYGQRLYLTHKQAKEISSFYGFDLTLQPAQLKNSRLYIVPDTQRRLYFLVRKAPQRP